MTRLLLASIVFAVLQLGIPGGAKAAQLRPVDESTRVAPRCETPSNGLLTRARPDDVRLTHATSCAPAAHGGLRLHAVCAAFRAREQGRSGPVALPSLFPQPRAPPA